VRGAGFTPRGNIVRFGAGYIRDLGSPDGKTLRFTVPEGLDLSPPGGPAADAYPPVRPGTYEVSVLNALGASNSATFVVTPK